MKLSLVVPCYNEEKVLPIFFEEVQKIVNNDFKDTLENQNNVLISNNNNFVWTYV